MNIVPHFLMDFTDENSDSGNVESSSSHAFYAASPTANAVDNDLGDHLDNPFGCQTEQGSNVFEVQASRLLSTTQSSPEKNVGSEEIGCSECMGAVEPFCHVNLDSLLKLKNSTRKLLCLVEEIQAKTVSKSSVRNNYNQFCLSDLLQSNSISTLKSPNPITSLADLVGANAIKKLETQAQTLEAIETEEDDCSIYKRLTRKCHCLNQLEYNDLIIHFNESTRYFTSTLGEIIKNIRIVKKFIFMGGYYTKNALMFLNEGLSNSTHSEKVDIIQGCAHADVCNVFDDQTIVVICMTAPCNGTREDTTIQTLTASILHKLAQVEEGRRYLNFSSKIANDIKKILRKKFTKIGDDVLETLNAALNLMHPPLSQHTTVTYYCKPVDEGYGRRALAPLLQYREFMTLEEIYNHLDVLNNLSNNDSFKSELIMSLPTLLNLFKHMLVEYDNSKINILITNILNNVVSKNMIKQQESPKTVVMAETATEPIITKNESNQIPTKKNPIKKGFKSRLRFNTSPHRCQSKKKSLAWQPSLNIPNKSTGIEPKPYSVIVVPLEKKMKL